MKNLETNPKKWESELIQNFEMNYSKQLEMNDN